MATVLVVDDNTTERRLMYHALKSEHSVLEAADAEAALAWLEMRSVDLVVLDMHLAPRTETRPEGLRLHAAIRDRPAPPPVVVVSSDADPTLVDTMRSSGVSDYLIKPVDTAALHRAISKALLPRRAK